MSLLRKLLGRTGEDRAADHLAGRGFRILERNYSAPYGEIDLIALDGDTVVFVEVKTRRGAGALEAVDARKQKWLSRLALVFLGQLAVRR